VNQTAFDEGYNTYVNEGEITDNPYKKSFTDHNDWEEGYYAAMNADYLASVEPSSLEEKKVNEETKP